MIPGLITGGVVVLTILAFAWWAIAAVRSAERTTADARVDATSKAGQLAIAASDIAAHKARADYWKGQADALDLELETVAADGDAAGARERVLRRQARTDRADTATTGGGSAGGVLGGGQDPAVASRSSDDLAKPGD